MITEQKDEDFNLEEAFERLEKTVAELERDDISLEDSFREYQKGMELLKKCSETIDGVEKRVLVLNENGELNEF